MGLGAGGRMHQEIFPDAYGWKTWNPRLIGRVEVRLCGVEDWRSRTGEEPPPSPIDAQAYTDAGLPWFDLYSERGDLPPSDELARVLAVQEMERAGSWRRTACRFLRRRSPS